MTELTAALPAGAAGTAGAARVATRRLLAVRRYLPAALLALGCALVWGARGQQRVPPAAPLASLPTELLGYRAADLTIGDEERRVAGMSDYVMRVFRRDSADVFSVYVGYYDYQVQGKTIHSPRNCLPGAGWEALEGGARTVSAPVDGGTAPFSINRYLLANGTSRALVYYWYQGRGRVEANEYRVKWNLLRDAALRGRTEEALVRIVVPLAPPTPADPRPVETADALAQATAARLISEVARVMPRATGG
ncbi:MAG: exosortase C-terminal domain/associated protein EpsI [Gemmatimonadaceae bacterium]